MERNLMIAGFGGQGVMMMGKLIAQTACENGQDNVSFFPSYGAEQRGGTANCYVVISDEAVGAPLSDEINELIVMNKPSLTKFQNKLLPGGTLFVNSSLINASDTPEDCVVVAAPVTELALELGSSKVQNIIMLGVYAAYTGVLPEEALRKAILAKLIRKPELSQLNQEAFTRGLALGREILGQR